MTFHNIFQSKERNQFKMFKQFLVNLEVWGSYSNLPLDNQGVFNTKSAKKMTEYQISDLLDALSHIVKETRSHHFPILKMLIEKAGTIGYFIAKIQKYLQAKTDEESANLLNGRDDDYNSENESLVNRDNTFDTFENEESLNFLNISKITEENIGYYIPLK